MCSAVPAELVPYRRAARDRRTTRPVLCDYPLTVTGNLTGSHPTSSLWSLGDSNP
ncbi:MAG: hypothetical protein QOK33_5739 [Mycobacterium sp.]|nr:hypothetical protein [Mycobacterium sp.]